MRRWYSSSWTAPGCCRRARSAHSADRDGIRPERQGFGDVGAAQIPPETTSCTFRCIPRRPCSRIDSEPNGGSVGMPTCSMNTSCVAACPPCSPSTTDLHGQLDVVEGPGSTDLDEDRLLHGDLAQLVELDIGPVQLRVTRALVDPRGRSRVSATRSRSCGRAAFPRPRASPCPTTTSIASAARRSVRSSRTGKGESGRRAPSSSAAPPGVIPPSPVLGRGPDPRLQLERLLRRCRTARRSSCPRS